MSAATVARLVLAWLAAGIAVAAHAQDGTCRIEPYRGASAPEGAVAQVSMRNRGVACVMPNYGAPDERRYPADSGRIVKPASHGDVRFDAPNAVYLPAPGFAGEDEFQYEAFARGASGQPVRLLVTVKVRVDRR